MVKSQWKTVPSSWAFCRTMWLDLVQDPPCGPFFRTVWLALAQDRPRGPLFRTLCRTNHAGPLSRTMWLALAQDRPCGPLFRTMWLALVQDQPCGAPLQDQVVGACAWGAHVGPSSGPCVWPLCRTAHVGHFQDNVSGPCEGPPMWAPLQGLVVGPCAGPTMQNTSCFRSHHLPKHQTTTILQLKNTTSSDELLTKATQSTNPHPYVTDNY